MNQGMMNTIIAAVVGGIVGAGVVFFTSGNKVEPTELDLKSLKVASLTITEGAVLLNAEGTPELFIRDGSVLAEKVILGNKVVAQQVQGHAIVANRMFATPDNLVTTPMDQWRFFAEVGASTTDGGEIVVRSVAGPSSVGRATTTGAVLRQGFTPEGLPQLLAVFNSNRSLMEITHDWSEQQKVAMSIPANAGVTSPLPSSFSSEAVAPLYNNGASTTANLQGVGTTQ